VAGSAKSVLEMLSALAVQPAVFLNVMLISAEQFLNAPYSILFTLLDMVIFLRDVQFLKA